MRALDPHEELWEHCGALHGDWVRPCPSYMAAERGGKIDGFAASNELLIEVVKALDVVFRLVTGQTGAEAKVHEGQPWVLDCCDTAYLGASSISRPRTAYSAYLGDHLHPKLVSRVNKSRLVDSCSPQCSRVALDDQGGYLPEGGWAGGHTDRSCLTK